MSVVAVLYHDFGNSVSTTPNLETKRFSKPPSNHPPSQISLVLFVNCERQKEGSTNFFDHYESWGWPTPWIEKTRDGLQSIFNLYFLVLVLIFVVAYWLLTTYKQKRTIPYEKEDSIFLTEPASYIHDLYFIIHELHWIIRGVVYSVLNAS